MEQKLNSYGKTIHVWKAGVYGQEDEKFPLGEPRLAWSFNHLHEPQQGLLESVYESLDISVEQNGRNGTIWFLRQRLNAESMPLPENLKGN